MTINKVRSKSKPAIDLMLFNKEATRLLSDVQCLKQTTNDIYKPSVLRSQSLLQACYLAVITSLAPA